MATEVRSFTVTIAAGTAKTAPVTVDTSFPARDVERIDIKVPPGPSGLMGFQLTVGGLQVVPINLGEYKVTDDEKLSYPLTDLPNGGGWQVTGYNTDIYDHSIYVDYYLAPLGSTTSGGAVAASAAGSAAALQIAAG